MGILKTNINKTSEEYRQRSNDYRSLIDRLRDLSTSALAPATPAQVEKTRSRNKLLTEERIELLIDRGASVLELSPLAGYNCYDSVPPGAGVRALISTVNEVKCMIIANNPLIKGGCYFPLSVKKHLRAQEIALENSLPCIYLVDSGGAFLPLQSELFPDKEHFGRIFYNQAQLSKARIPQIAVVLGLSTAGGAYVPAMCDETIMVKSNSSIYLGGPPLVKAATGEEITSEELGGADVHCRHSGVADYMANNEKEAILLARNIISNINAENKPTLSSREIEPPLYDASELYGIVPTDLRHSFSALEIIARIVDGSRFSEFKELYGETIKCGFAKISGISVGIIANDGILFSESALKVTHFIQLCNQRQTPIIFLQNIVGFMVGKDYERNGIAKHGAKMVTAVATADVPKYTVIIGGSFGAGNYGMCGRAYQPRFLFTWPGSKISVMGGKQASEVLSSVKFDENSENSEVENYKKKIVDKYETEGNAFYATANIWDDGIIDPAKTRQVLTLALKADQSQLSTQRESKSKLSYGVFRM